VACASTCTRERIYATHVLVTVLRGSALYGLRKNMHKRSLSPDACSRVCACGCVGNVFAEKATLKVKKNVLEWTYIVCILYMRITCLESGAQPGGGIWGIFPPEIFKTLHRNFDICRNFKE